MNTHEDPQNKRAKKQQHWTVPTPVSPQKVGSKLQSDWKVS